MKGYLISKLSIHNNRWVVLDLKWLFILCQGQNVLQDRDLSSTYLPDMSECNITWPCFFIIIIADCKYFTNDSHTATRLLHAPRLSRTPSLPSSVLLSCETIYTFVFVRRVCVCGVCSTVCYLLYTVLFPVSVRLPCNEIKVMEYFGLHCLWTFGHRESGGDSEWVKVGERPWVPSVLVWFYGSQFVISALK